MTGSESSLGARRGTRGGTPLPPRVRRHQKHQAAEGQGTESGSSDKGSPFLSEGWPGPSARRALQVSLGRWT